MCTQIAENLSTLQIATDVATPYSFTPPRLYQFYPSATSFYNRFAGMRKRGNPSLMAASPDERPKEEVAYHQSSKQATPDGDVMDYIEQLLKHYPRASYFHRHFGKRMTKRQISYLLPGIPEMNNQYNAPEAKVYQNKIPDENEIREVEVKNIVDLPGGGQIRDTFWCGFFYVVLR